jgi:orotate phosphoribosyltransferase
MTLTDLQDSIVALVARWGYERREKPFTLSAGFETHDYIDGKRAVATTSRLHQVARAFLQVAAEQGAEFDAVGGLTMGADPIALAITMAADTEKQWFSVRKEPKVHGKQQMIEGIELLPGTRVLLVDDVVTTGRSILQALDAIEATGASVVLASALVDRGLGTSRRLASRGIPYHPLINYADLGIEPVPDVGRVPA